MNEIKICAKKLTIKLLGEQLLNAYPPTAN